MSDATEPDDVQLASPVPRWAIIGIFLMLFVASLAYAQVFLTPILLAFILAFVFSPARRALERIGLPSGVAAGAILLGILAVLGVIVFLLAQPVRQWAEDAPEIGAQLEDRVRAIRASFGADEDGASIQDVVEKVGEAAAPAGDEEVTEVVVKEPGALSAIAATAPAIAVQLILTLVLLFFILASGDMFYEKMVHVIPRFRDKRRAIRIAREIERKISHYLLTITVINAGLGVSIGLALWALGIPDPLLFGVAAMLLNYIPYVGAIIGAGLTLIVGLLTFPETGHAIAPALAYYGLTSFEGQFVTPYFVGRNLKLNTVVVFIAVAFWAWLWSVVGMLMAVPLLVMIRVFCEHIPALEPFGDFLSARGAEIEDDEEVRSGQTPAGEEPKVNVAAE